MALRVMKIAKATGIDGCHVECLSRACVDQVFVLGQVCKEFIEKGNGQVDAEASQKVKDAIKCLGWMKRVMRNSKFKRIFVYIMRSSFFGLVVEDRGKSDAPKFNHRYVTRSGFPSPVQQRTFMCKCFPSPFPAYIEETLAPVPGTSTNKRCLVRLKKTGSCPHEMLSTRHSCLGCVKPVVAEIYEIRLLP
ncbi:hypothetical protein SK128_004866 [Halocaridina rubra]|uniref:Uncharacterized protein n=1 Tax=Halocaridina rubra TaxID=373956 RepID=A0AAN8XKQ8_HALRR